MSVEQRKVVDFIGTSKADGHVILTITNHLPFDGDKARLVTLQDKLSDYLAFIESGELCDAYPAAAGKPVEISVRFKHVPDAQAVAFLHATQQTVSDAGFSFSYETTDLQPPENA